MDSDPFSRDNPIGPGATLSSYKSGGNAVGTGLRYAALVREQESLDVSGFDAGLAVLVAEHQSQLKRQAAEFVDAVVPDFITLVSDAGNFADLFAAVAKVTTPNLHLSETAGKEVLTGIADSAGEIGADGDTAIDHVTLLGTDLDRVGRRLDSALERALTAVGKDGKAASDRIDELTKKISENIQAIVDGANATGDAVTELGIGILTEITKHTGDNPTPPDPTDDSDDDSTSDAGSAVDTDSGSDGDDSGGDGGDDDDDASTTNKSDGKVPDVSFVVSAIKAASKGTEKYAAAIADLQRNNDLLAAQYQRLATANRLIAVAKVTQAQQSLFTTSVTDMAAAVKTIRAGWSKLREALADWSDASSAAELDRLLPGALKQWQAVAGDLTKLRRALTSADKMLTR